MGDAHVILNEETLKQVAKFRYLGADIEAGSPWRDRRGEARHREEGEEIFESCEAKLKRKQKKTNLSVEYKNVDVSGDLCYQLFCKAVTLLRQG